MRGRIKIYLGLLFLLGLMIPGKVWAHANLLINEIYPKTISSSPHQEENTEWIEIFNAGDEPARTADLTIEDYDKSRLPTSLSHKPDILPGSYLVLYKGVDNDFTFSLNDGGDRLILKYGGVVMDQVSYGVLPYEDNSQNAPVPAAGRSITRLSGKMNTGVNKDDFISSIPSPNRAYEKPVYSKDIIISEIYPSPNADEQEYIELFNKSEKPVNLKDWIVNDVVEGGSPQHTFDSDLWIAPNSYLALNHDEIKIFLNDSGDAVNLFDPNQDLVNSIEYSGGERGKSYSLFADGWKWTEEATPDKENIFKETNSLDGQEISPGDNIHDIKKYDRGNLVEVEGTVIVLPGKLSSQYFYIEDYSGGIQIYSHDKQFPDLAVGDRIKVVGELSEINGEKRIKVKSETDIIFLDNGRPPEPKKAAISEINDDVVGEYLQVEGKVVATSGSEFTIEDDDNHEVQVSIRTGTGIKKPRMRKGDQVEITGVISKSKSGYAILPTKQEDVKIITSGTLPKAGSEGAMLPVIYSSILTLLWNILAKAKKRLKRLQRMLPPLSRVARF